MLISWEWRGLPEWDCPLEKDRDTQTQGERERN